MFTQLFHHSCQNLNHQTKSTEYRYYFWVCRQNNTKHMMRKFTRSTTIFVDPYTSVKFCVSAAYGLWADRQALLWLKIITTLIDWLIIVTWYTYKIIQYNNFVYKRYPGLLDFSVTIGQIWTALWNKLCLSKYYSSRLVSIVVWILYDPIIWKQWQGAF